MQLQEAGVYPYNENISNADMSRSDGERGYKHAERAGNEIGNGFTNYRTNITLSINPPY